MSNGPPPFVCECFYLVDRFVANTMRLRVTVRRHSLPDTPIIWVIDTNTAPTVFQLLEQINEIIPIESDGEWGLDDYAVELKGITGVNYECLHFQPVATVMKEDDEVLIRPLLSQDIKIRRISGRRQISSFGAHLLDGVVFGRPLLRLTDRPSIHIPPRKKRRITSDEEESLQDEQAALEDQQMEGKGDESGNRQLVLHADFNDEDSEEDEDFAPLEADEDEDDDEDAEVESESSDDEMEGNDQKCDPNDEERDTSPISENIEPCLSGIKDPTIRAKIRKLHAAFPSAKLGVCKHVMKGTHYDLGDAYDAMLTGFPSVQPKSAVTEIPQGTGDLTVRKTRAEAPTAAVEQSEIPDSMQEELDETPDPMIDFYDQNGLPPGSIASGKALSFMADALKGTPTRLRSESRRLSLVGGRSVKFAVGEDVPVDLDSTPAMDMLSEKDESSEEESDESSEEDSSSDDESSEASTDSSDEEMDNSPEESSSSSSDSDSESSSDSSSDEDEPEEKSSKIGSALPLQPDVKVASALEITTSKPKSAQHVASPGMGTQQTQSRNQRRWRANVFRKCKDKEILPADTTIEEFKLLDPNQLGSREEASAALLALRTTQAAAAEARNTKGSATQRLLADAEKFELRRKELLASLAEGGIDISKETTQKTSKTRSALRDAMGSQSATNVTEKVNPIPVNGRPYTDTPSNISAPKMATTEAEAMEIDTISDVALLAKTQVEEPKAGPTAQPISTESTPAAQTPRRAKLDLGAGRRMLFGALGIKNPKTKKDEEKLRKDLMKDVRPLLTPKAVDEENLVLEEVVSEDPDAWKSNITYRAVECVQEDVELSEPPFPFKQRWDPQQWNDRNGKRKKDQRDQPQFYDENRPSKKQKRRKGKNTRREENEYPEEPLELSYDDSYDAQYDESAQISRPQTHDAGGEFSQGLMHNFQDPSEAVSQNPDDLAPLPEDPTSLPDLVMGNAQIGMTIAFKCLEMSEATKWQPKISPYRTAIVISILDNGELQLSLAMRDRKPGKLYDEETGERLYGKFEMPDDDDEMDEEDDGVVNHQYSEFVEPKVVQWPPGSLSADTQVENNLQYDGGPKGDTSATISNEEGSAEAKFSHVTETPLNTDVQELPDSMQVDKVVSNVPAQELLDMHPVLTIETTAPATPGLRVREGLNAEVLTPSAQISDENRRNVSHMMKDAGFRSSIPSSIIRSIQPETPGDTAAFQRLMDDMTEKPEETPYSPKFNGFESSPPKNDANIQFDTHDSSLAAAVQSSSSQNPPQSRWRTANPQPQSPTPTPPPAGQKEASMIATDIIVDESEGSSDDSASPTPEEVKAEHKKLPRKVPVSKAQLLWEQLQPKSRRGSTDSSPDSEKISQATSIGLDGSSEIGSNVSIQYPKLSIGSSFTSQITDHGRQPDFEFDDSELLTAGTPMIVKSEASPKNWAQQELDMGSISANPVSKNRDTGHLEHPLSDSEADVITRKTVGGRPSNASRLPEAPEIQSSSDELPSLATLSQQSQAYKQEKSKSVEPKISKATLKKNAATMSEDDNAPKPGSKQRRESQHRKVSVPQQRKNAPPASQPQLRASQSRPPQSELAVSQVVDLTQSSSELEEELKPAYKPEPKASKRTKRSELPPSDDEDDDDYEASDMGWVPKKKSVFDTGAGKRQTSTGFKGSSQTAVNTRRRTSSK